MAIKAVERQPRSLHLLQEPQRQPAVIAGASLVSFETHDPSGRWKACDFLAACPILATALTRNLKADNSICVHSRLVSLEDRPGKGAGVTLRWKCSSRAASSALTASQKPCVAMTRCSSPSCSLCSTTLAVHEPAKHDHTGQCFLAFGQLNQMRLSLMHQQQMMM